MTTRSVRISAGSSGSHLISGTWRAIDAEVSNHAEDTILKISGNRIIPGIGIVLLISLAVIFVAPIVAIGLATAALIRQPPAPLDFLTFGCAIAALLCQVLLFQNSKWL